MTFAQAVPESIDIDGLLHQRRGDRDIELVLVKTPDDRIEQWAQSHQAEEVEIADMSLEDQFIEFTAPKQCQTLFRWETT